MSTEIVIGKIVGQTTAGDLYPGCQIFTLEIFAKVSAPEQTQQSPPVAPEPLASPPVVSEPEEAFPWLIDSRLFPGVIYNLCQGTATYESDPVPIPSGVFRLLWYLERHGGVSAKEDAKAACWSKDGTESALKHAIDRTNVFVIKLGLSAEITDSNGIIRVVSPFVGRENP